MFDLIVFDERTALLGREMAFDYASKRGSSRLGIVEKEKFIVPARHLHFLIDALSEFTLLLTRNNSETCLSHDAFPLDPNVCKHDGPLACTWRNLASPFRIERGEFSRIHAIGGTLVSVSAVVSTLC